MVINRKIKFIIHCRKKGDSVNGKNLGILMRVTIRGHAPFDFSLGANVDAEYWDEKSQRVKDGFVNENNLSTIAINNAIEDYRRNINEVFSVFELIEKRIPTIKEIREKFDEKIGKKSELEDPETDGIDLYVIFDKFIKSEGSNKQWTQSTYKKFKTLRNHLKAFDPYLTLDKINDNKMEQLVEYFYKVNLINTTVSKTLKFFNWFLRWAQKNGYYTGNSHVNFKPKLRGSEGVHNEPIHLTIEELEIIKNYQFKESEKHLERTRDVFLFCCYTGLRYSDVFNLQKSDIKNGYIRIVSQKDTDGLKIELNETAKKILDKYKDCNFEKGKALPVISNQKMNSQLKEIGQMCEFNSPEKRVWFKKNERNEEEHPKWTLLTTHVGRRTFIVNGLTLGIPGEVIMRWTGHSDFKAMKPYMKIVDSLKKSEMEKFNKI